MRRDRVLVLYNEPILPETHPDYISEVEVLDNVEGVRDTLRESGYEVDTFGAPNEPEALIRGIRERQPDVVVNLFEGNPLNNATELYAAGLLEWLGLPYTGCPFQTLVLANNKPIAKRLFQAEGLPTAPFFVVDRGPVTHCPINFPAIIKPAQQDASVGLDQSSVVTDLEALNRRVTFLLEQFNQPVLVEEFIFGRELTVALAEMPELRLLPGTEVVFLRNEPGYWPILSYDAKWTEEHAEYGATDYHFKADLSPALEAKIEAAARGAFRVLGCRDYARVDFRIRRGDDQPMILELNPNPDFAPERAFANNLWAAGLSHAEFAVQLVRNALARKGPGVAARFRTLQAS